MSTKTVRLHHRNGNIEIFDRTEENAEEIRAMWWRAIEDVHEDGEMFNRVFTYVGATRTSYIDLRAIWMVEVEDA